MTWPKLQGKVWGNLMQALPEIPDVRESAWWSRHEDFFHGLRSTLDPNLVLVVLFTVFAFAPLAYPGFFQAHSGFLPVFHLYDLEADLWGNWGWAPHLASSPNPLTGEGALPYLIAELLRWFGLDGVQAIKSVYALGFVISGVTAYLQPKYGF